MFLVAPQWQGSGSSRALRLREGAEAITGDLPAAATRVLEAPLEAGDEQGSGIARLSAILVMRDRIRSALAGQLGNGNSAGPVITIGGDAGVSLAAVEHAWRDDTALVWFDAHGALNTPASSGTGAFHGMVLRTLLGDGDAGLVPARPVPLHRLVPVGTRSLEPAEDDFLQEHGISPLRFPTPDALLDAVGATGARSVYLHLDLDVLDPGEISGVGFPEPFGLETATLAACIRELLASFELIGATIAEFAPSDPVAAADDLPAILRLIAALRA